MNWISGLKPKQMFVFRPKKWATRKWEDEFQVYFNKPFVSTEEENLVSKYLCAFDALFK